MSKHLDLLDHCRMAMIIYGFALVILLVAALISRDIGVLGWSVIILTALSAIGFFYVKDQLQVVWAFLNVLTVEGKEKFIEEAVKERHFELGLMLRIHYGKSSGFGERFSSCVDGLSAETTAMLISCIRNNEGLTWFITFQNPEFGREILSHMSFKDKTRLLKEWRSFTIFREDFGFTMADLGNSQEIVQLLMSTHIDLAVRNFLLSWKKFEESEENDKQIKLWRLSPEEKAELDGKTKEALREAMRYALQNCPRWAKKFLRALAQQNNTLSEELSQLARSE